MSEQRIDVTFRTRMSGGSSAGIADYIESRLNEPFTVATEGVVPCSHSVPTHKSVYTEQIVFKGIGISGNSLDIEFAIVSRTVRN